MKRTDQAVEAIDMAREISSLRSAATAAQEELRTLKELEMGWIAGGDGMPVWPY